MRTKLDTRAKTNPSLLCGRDVRMHLLAGQKARQVFMCSVSSVLFDRFLCLS